MRLDLNCVFSDFAFQTLVNRAKRCNNFKGRCIEYATANYSQTNPVKRNFYNCYFAKRKIRLLLVLKHCSPTSPITRFSTLFAKKHCSRVFDCVIKLQSKIERVGLKHFSFSLGIVLTLLISNSLFEHCGMFLL